jgi:lipoyl(octanoyl) transferase
MEINSLAIQYIDWGMINYEEAYEKQKILFTATVNQKDDFANYNPSKSNQLFIFCQHPHVYTLGKNGNINNLLINSEFLRHIHATYHHIDRGGDITYHGPGQIVCYPILDIEALHLSLKSYIYVLEEAIIYTLKEYNIISSRLCGATGIWLDVNCKCPRKICAIGVRATRYVTMHGFAFNANTDLQYFSYINPCGIMDKEVTSLAMELKQCVNEELIKKQIYSHFCALLQEHIKKHC